MAVSKKQTTVSRYFRTSKANVNLPHRPLICGETVSKQEGPAHHFCNKEKCKISVQIVIPAKPVQEIVSEPAVQPIALEPIFEPTYESTCEQSFEPTFKPTFEPVIQQIALEPTFEQAIEQSIKASIEPFIQPSIDPTSQLSYEQRIDRIFEGIFAESDAHTTPLKQQRNALLPTKSILKSPTPIGGFKVIKRVKKSVRGENLKALSLQRLARVGGLRSLPEALEQTAKSALQTYLTSLLRTIASNATQQGSTIVTRSDIIAVLRTRSVVEDGFN